MLTNYLQSVNLLCYNTNSVIFCPFIISVCPAPSFCWLPGTNMSIIHHKHEQLESAVPACYTIMSWPSFSSSGPEMDRNDKSEIKKKVRSLNGYISESRIEWPIILSKPWIIKGHELNLSRICDVVFKDRQIARLRLYASSPRLCVTVILLRSLHAVMADVCETDVMMNYHGDFVKSDRKSPRYPYCIVWTPIPILS